MSHKWKYGARAVMMAMLLVVVSCTDTGDRLSGPVDETAPQALLFGKSSSEPTLVQGFFPNPLGNGATCNVLGGADSSPNELRSAAWIGATGGVVTLIGGSVNGKVVAHTLTVPSTAVKQPTLFCLELVPENHMQVRLQAHALDAAGNVVNVGANGFSVPVVLTLTFATVDLSPFAARRVKVLYDPENGSTFEGTRSVSLWPIAPLVVAELDHFSKYAMAVD